MAWLEPLIMAALQGLMTRPQRITRGGMSGLWLLALSCLLACAGIIYFLIALDSSLAPAYGPVIAALATGTFAFILAGVAAAGFTWLDRPARPAAQENPLSAGEALFAAVEQATEGLEEPIAENPRTSVLLASLAGYLAGNRVH